MVTYKTLLESYMVKKKTQKNKQANNKPQYFEKKKQNCNSCLPVLAIPKPSHNITIRTYFADKALHQGFCIGSFFHTCRVTSLSLARSKNKPCWWVIYHPSHTHGVNVVLCYQIFFWDVLYGAYWQKINSNPERKALLVTTHLHSNIPLPHSQQK